MKKQSPFHSTAAKTALALALLSPAFAPVTAQAATTATTVQQPITVTIDGQLQSYDQPPVIVNDRVLVPLRGIFEALGAEVEWHAKSQQIVATRNGNEVRLTIGDTAVWINQSPAYLIEMAPQIRNDRTLVPIRFISELFGADVKWDAAKRNVIITRDNMRLFDAIDSKNHTDLQNLLKGGMSPDIIAYGENAVGYAFEKGNLEAVKLLLQSGGDKIGARASLALQGNTEQMKLYMEHYQPADPAFPPVQDQFLYHSIATNKTESFRAALQAGADVNGTKVRQYLKSGYNQIPLYYALYSNNTEIIHDLLEAGADPNLPINQYGIRTYLIFHPAEFGKTAMLRDLLKHGANPNLQDELGWSALMVAADNGNLPAVQELLTAKADPNLKSKQGATALMIAEAHGNTQISEALRAAGATTSTKKPGPSALTRNYTEKINSIGPNWTPLMKAAFLGDTGQVKTHLANGADPNQPVPPLDTHTPFTLAVYTGNYELIQAFLQGKTPIDTKYKNELLYSAVQGNHLELAELALENGADLNADDMGMSEPLGHSLLMWVSQLNNLEMIDLLLQKGVNAQTYESFSAPILGPAANGHVTALQNMLTSLTDEKVRQSEGGQALIQSVQHGNIDSVRMLLTLGIDPNVSSDDGRTPLSIATKFGYQNIIDELTKAGATE